MVVALASGVNPLFQEVFTFARPASTAATRHILWAIRLRVKAVFGHCLGWVGFQERSGNASLKALALRTGEAVRYNWCDEL